MRPPGKIDALRAAAWLKVAAMNASPPFPRAISAFVLLVQIVLGWAPTADRLTWALENFPVWTGLGLLVWKWRSFPLSRLCLWLLAVHSVILAVGGHWTYAEVPAGHWVKEWLHLSRNPYDRLGHVAQGFIPALFVRELLLRQTPLPRGAWLSFLVVCVCLAFSACYEIFEWQTAVITGEAAESFLGTQGDVWDTQWDMALALIGSSAALLLLSRAHDRSLAGLGVGG